MTRRKLTANLTQQHFQQLAWQAMDSNGCIANVAGVAPLSAACCAGNGSSITAVKNGLSVDTTMGLTPLEG
jgi:hypothetical protein